MRCLLPLLVIAATAGLAVTAEGAGLDLRVDLVAVPGVDDVTLDDASFRVQRLVQTPAMLAHLSSLGPAIVSHASDVDDEYGPGLYVGCVCGTPGPVGIRLRGGVFLRNHRGEVVETLNIAHPVSFGVADTGATDIVPAGTYYTPVLGVEVHTDGYLAAGVELGVALVADLGVVVLELGPFLDLGAGMGLDPEVAAVASWSIPSFLVVGWNDDIDVKPGFYYAYGLEGNVLFRVADGVQVGVGLFYLRGEGEDDSDVSLGTTAVFPPAMDQAHLAGSYDRTFEFDGLGVKASLGLNW